MKYFTMFTMILRDIISYAFDKTNIIILCNNSDFDGMKYEFGACEYSIVIVTQ